MKALASVLILIFAGLATPCLGQIPVFTPEFQVNTATANYLFSDAVAMGPGGDFVVTWSADTANFDVLGRRFDAQTVPLDGPFPANAFTTGNQFHSSVAKDASGRFVVVWSDENTEIWGRRFAADGTPLGGDFQVNTATPINTTYPHVASDPSGNFVVAWTSTSAAGADVTARRFDSNGSPLGDEFTLNTATGGFQGASGIAMSPAGFVVTWGGAGSGTPNGIFAKLFDPAGNPVTFDLHVHTGPLTSPNPRLPDVAMSAAGDFVIVWDDGDNTAYSSVGRRWSIVGVPAGGVFPISSASALAYDPRVASDSAGNFVVTWTSEPLSTLDGDGTGIAARLYDIGGFAVSPEFQVNEVTTGNQFFSNPGMADDGSFVVSWTDGSGSDYAVKGRKSGVRASPQIGLDPNNLSEGSSPDGGNGVFEPGEAVALQTAWVNDTAADVVALTGTAPLFTGPAGPVYTINDGTASYGTIAAGQTASCIAGGDCYAVAVSAPATRPVQHWDALLQENLSIGVPKTWELHIGESFPDVPTDNLFYAFIETLFHNRVTGGCAGGGYCPTNPVTRAQMAVFLLKAKLGAAHIPPPCTGTVFTDVPCTGGPFDPWIEELAALAITGGCGGGNYCPNATVTRQQMAVFLLKALLGSTYVPPVCAGDFDDVPCPSQFADWIEDLYGRSITGGCQASPPLYCPTNPNNRGQMAVFLTKTFGLVLYGT